jgi:hypothetical protein
MPSADTQKMIGVSLYQKKRRGKQSPILLLFLLFFRKFVTMSNGNIPYSCDTFVVLPPLTDSNFRIFGKNSDRPANEVQEIIFVSKEHTSDNKDYVQVRYFSYFL